MLKNTVGSKWNIAVVGLGYVGMPIAVEFSKKFKVIGFDINGKKVALYKKGVDPTKEVGDEIISSCDVHWTSNEKELSNANFIIVAVPTPIKKDTTPDLTPLISSSTIVGRNLKKGAIVVYESTVYPGVTEEICLPILERESGLKFGKDFKIGYSPERINPGDKKHRLVSIKKIVSGSDDEALASIASVYSSIIEAGIYKAESIKVAEAAKVIENSQRDINIAFMNELSIIFNKMNLDTQAVLNAASTKWNFLPFKPGLVGGHCIGVDPYYLTYRAEQFGYTSQIILAGRKLNDSMGKYIAETTVKKLISNDSKIKGAKIGIMGITFKENCPDVRNSKVNDIILELSEYGIDPLVFDPIADKDDSKNFYNVKLCNLEELSNLDALIIAVAHDVFSNLQNKDLLGLFSKMHKPILIDVKGIRNRDEMLKCGFDYWRL